MFDVLIERGKIREFALATRSSHPDFTGPAALAPPTFLNAASRIWADEPLDIARDLGFDPARTLHGEEEFVFHAAPPRAGDRLGVTVQVTGRAEKTRRNGDRMRLAVVVREFRDAAGRLVAEQRSTLVETGPGERP
ncbi:FAS1-like dehydratase domain-containing protein [Actinomadura rugatobispora]|uniref:MaoC family dehydratase N-terminal domain-containing protein n=1 Tax=Actinomadura rugatobispora TaxID=1994 RepID=A0ABW0ZVV4_9ACTN|nr:MaoC family dehydratase N-terminal domain-containing protein [Actinomadura rugatobispora]